MNILILSKIWYTLRLMKPTKRVLSSLRSIIYQFIWQKKHPALKKKLYSPLDLWWTQGNGSQNSTGYSSKKMA